MRQLASASLALRLIAFSAFLADDGSYDDRIKPEQLDDLSQLPSGIEVPSICRTPESLDRMSRSNRN